jgi:hypothetical protein
LIELVDISLGRVGYHMDAIAALDPAALVAWAKMLVATPILYASACAFARLMLLWLYLRLFEARRSYRYACYILMVLVIALVAGNIVVSGLQCIPIAYLWDKTIPGGRCIDIPAFYRWATLLPNVFIDLLMLILPQPVVWKLQTQTHVKLGLAATFLTGST